jgi:hypothetical protein
MHCRLFQHGDQQTYAQTVITPNKAVLLYKRLKEISMEKKLLLVIISIWLITPFVGFPQETKTTSEAPVSDNTHKAGNATIKFIPPKDWKLWIPKINASPEGFMFVPVGDSKLMNLTFLVTSVVQSPWNTITLEAALEPLKKDTDVEYAQIQPFAGTNALVTITKMGETKIKQIQFVKGANSYGIIFTAESGSFDKSLPSIDESLKSFEIVAELPQNTTIEKDNPENPSKALYNKFELIAEKMTSESLKRKAGKEGFNEVTEKTLPAITKEATAGLMEHNHDAFIVPDVEAKKILDGELNDSSNIADIKTCVDALAQIPVALPEPITYLIEKYTKRSLSSLELEFTKRVLGAYVKEAAEKPKK